MVGAEGSLQRAFRVSYPGPGTRWSAWRMLTKILKNLGGAKVAHRPLDPTQAGKYEERNMYVFTFHSGYLKDTQ